MKQLLFIVFIFSLSFSACSSSRLASNSNVSYQTQEKQNVAYSSANAMMSNSSSMSNGLGGSVEFKKEIGSDTETQGERYAKTEENPFLETARAPLSTFSIDVDTASYANVRRYLNDGQLPPKDTVRIEELVNYFEYDYPQPVSDIPFSVNTEVAMCAWNAKHKIVSIGLQGKKVSLDNVPPSNLVFLIDVSGSMNDPLKLPLLKNALRILVD